MTELKHIKNVVEEVTQQKIARNVRDNEVVLARNMYFYVCRRKTKYSLEKIGSLVGRHYASVLHGIKKLEEWMDSDKTVAAIYDAIMDVFDRDGSFSPMQGRDYDDVVKESVRLRKINTELVRRNLVLREKVNMLENIITKRNEYLTESGYVEKKQRAGTGYKAKVRQQIQSESAELGI